MNDSMSVEKAESDEHFPYDQADMVLLQRLSSRLQISSIHSKPEAIRWKLTKVLILPPSANSMIIQTLGPSIKLP